MPGSGASHEQKPDPSMTRPKIASLSETDSSGLATTTVDGWVSFSQRVTHSNATAEQQLRGNNTAALRKQTQASPHRIQTKASIDAADSALSENLVCPTMTEADSPESSMAMPCNETDTVLHEETITQQAKFVHARTSSSTSTLSSSGEEVVFRGRSNMAKTHPEAEPAQAIKDSAPLGIVEDEDNEVNDQDQTPMTAEPEMPAWQDIGHDWVHRSKPGYGWTRPRGRIKRKRRQGTILQPDEEDEIIRDYLMNIQEHAEDDMRDLGHLAYRDLALSDADRNVLHDSIPHGPPSTSSPSADMISGSGSEERSAPNGADHRQEHRHELVAEGGNNSLIELFRNPKFVNDAAEASETPTTAHNFQRDAYDGFDVMDLDRPSLHLKKRGKLPKFELSDEDLQVQLKSSWQKDREKKQKRKAERQETKSMGRAVGKGKKGAKDEKLFEGMSITEVKEELRVFLGSSTDS